MLTRYVQHGLTWIDLVSPTSAEVRLLMQEFGIEPAFAEELVVPSFRPKVEKKGGHIYAILHFPVLRGLNQRPQVEIDFLIGKNFLLTSRYSAADPLHAFAKVFEVNAVLRHDAAMTHGGHLFALIARNLYHELGAECSMLERKLEHIEEHIFTGDERKMVVEISHTGRVIYDFRQTLLPHKEALASLEAEGVRLFGAEYSFYMRGVQGEYERVRSIIEQVREALVELRETNNSLLSTKQNDLLKTFTIIAFLFLPLSFVASLFEMNTRYTPIVGMPGDFWIIISMMAVLAGGFFVYFKHSGWL